MKFEYLTDVAIADIAFCAEGKTREELMGNCGLALTSAMANTKKIGKNAKKEIVVEGKNDEELLYNFLEELVYLKDVDGVLFKKFGVKISQTKKNGNSGNNAMEMIVSCVGDTLDRIGRENLLNDVKAITMHMFEIKKENGKWAATVVVDI